MELVSTYEYALTGLNLSNKQKNQLPVWNWLMYKLSDYIWIHVGNNFYEDDVNDLDDNNAYVLWLSSITAGLKKTFYDANNERTFKCLINCPDESVAKIIYNETSYIIKKEFIEFYNPNKSPEEIIELIKKGENDCLEFKSTLRINLHTGDQDKKIEHSALKTLCAMLNSNGGILLIGC